MNFKKFISGVSAFAIAASAFAGMAVTANAAEGDVTNLANVTFTGNHDGATISGSRFAVADDRLKFGNGSATVTVDDSKIGALDKVEVKFKLAFGKLSGKKAYFNMKDADGKTIGETTFNAFGNEITSTTLDVDIDDIYCANNTVIWERNVDFDIVIDYNAKKITTNTSCLKSGAGKTATTATHVTDLPAGVGALKTFVVGADYNNDERRCEIDDIVIDAIEGPSVQTYAITTNYVDEQKNQIKDSTVAYVAGGSPYTPTYDATFDDDNYRYTYKSNTSIESVTEAATVEVVYSKAELDVHQVTVSANGGVNKTIGVYDVKDAKSVTYHYPQYMLDGKTLYKTTKQGSNPWWGVTVQNVTGNITKEHSYTEAATDVVYYSEAEDITGMSVVDYDNTEIRASNGAGAAATEKDVTFTKLPAGKYKIFWAVYGNAGTTFEIYAGEASNVVATLATAGNPTETASNEFELAESTNITIKQGGTAASNAKVIDYIYIVKTGDVEQGTPADETYKKGYKFEGTTIAEVLNKMVVLYADIDNVAKKAEVGTVASKLDTAMSAETNVELTVFVSNIPENYKNLRVVLEDVE